MSDCIIIAGPTATGKTDCAISLAKHCDGDIISADSRQAYTSMDIGTGKDISPKSQFILVDTIQVESQEYKIGYYIKENIRIWLYDLATPAQPMSSAIFRQAALRVFDHLHIGKRLPIIVGGTGYYLSNLVSPPKSLSVVPDEMLRKKYRHYSVENLQMELERENPDRLSTMNDSDRQNSRRLIRALEVAFSSNNVSSEIKPFTSDPVWIGLTAPISIIMEKITKRVNQRIENGFIAEVENLHRIYPSFSATPAGNTLGYREITDYLSGKIEYQTAINLWTTGEIQYMKRQITWFKKQESLHWFDITSENWYAQAKATLMKAGILCHT